MSEGESYTPVSCERHSEFELLILHNRKIILNWHDKMHIQHKAVVIPKDIQTRSGEEFLLVIDNNNEQHQIRLDYIQDFKEL